MVNVQKYEQVHDSQLTAKQESCVCLPSQSLHIGSNQISLLLIALQDGMGQCKIYFKKLDDIVRTKAKKI